MPKVVDYYNAQRYEETNIFIGKLRDCCSGGGKVFLDFIHTEQITAAAMISFLAEVDLLTSLSPYGRNAISFNNPSNEKVESVLKQVGFYDLVQKEERHTEEYDDVVFWQYASGIQSEPFRAKSMFGVIKKELQATGSRQLYRGFVEAMSNSVEHGYYACSERGEVSKWWAFAGIKDKELVAVICDKGVGISNTLPVTQEGRIEHIFSMLGIMGRKDSAFIKAASNLASTRTNLPNRGKGLSDIKSVIDKHGSGVVSIFSNKGHYIYRGKKGAVVDTTHDYKHSMNGTIVEWTLPLSEDSENE